MPEWRLSTTQQQLQLLLPAVNLNGKMSPLSSHQLMHHLSQGITISALTVPTNNKEGKGKSMMKVRCDDYWRCLLLQVPPPPPPHQGPDGSPAQTTTVLQTSDGITMPSRPHGAPPATGGHMMPAAAPAMQQSSHRIHTAAPVAPGAQHMTLLHECNNIMQQFAPMMATSGASDAGASSGNLPADAVQQLEMLQARLAVLLQQQGPGMGMISTAAQANQPATSAAPPTTLPAVASGGQSPFAAYYQQGSGQGHHGQMPFPDPSFTLPG